MDNAKPAVAQWPAIVAAARACIGTRFRPQGRMPGLGLDCVGLVIVAATAIGIRVHNIPSYHLGGEYPDIAELLRTYGCEPVAVRQSGDVLLIAPAARQRHLGIVTPGGIVHAHAGLERVVEGPIDPDWTIIGAWRLPGAR